MRFIHCQSRGARGVVSVWVWVRCRQSSSRPVSCSFTAPSSPGRKCQSAETFARALFLGLPAGGRQRPLGQAPGLGWMLQQTTLEGSPRKLNRFWNPAGNPGFRPWSLWEPDTLAVWPRPSPAAAA